ncbi:MAG: alkyl sulfatase dimerization domain-containing protein [Acidimicrobiales bacterium]
MNLDPRDASDITARMNAEVAATLQLDDERDTARATRGLLAARPSVQIPSAEKPIWDLASYSFLKGDAPATVNPSLWRQAKLNMNAGLFEVVPGIYQVRGFDYANISFVKSDTGWIVIDPLTTAVTAAAALELVNDELGERPVVAVIYTHSHVDHFGGVYGVIDPDDAASGDVRVIAPLGFLEAAVDETVIAGNAMARRATYMYGPLLPVGPKGHLDAGIGKGVPRGAPSLIAPNEIIDHTGQRLVVDGVPIEFHFTPDAEAPADMDFYFPDHKVLCMAENCVGTMHNIYTPRGAVVRDALSWSKYLNEAVHLFGGRAETMFICHHWPIWGQEEIVHHLEIQRDMYRFLHDETMRFANRGLTMDEIAEVLQLPEALQHESSCREYYGTVNHNAKAIYQRYLGWFDGNPAHLHRHPPEQLGARYVEALGGVDRALEMARRYHDDGDDRFAAELASHVVFADQDNTEAKELLADSLEQLGYQSESAPWRDFYLTGSNELRNGTMRGLARPYVPSDDITAAMTVEMLFDFLGMSLDGEWASDHPVDLALIIEAGDNSERWVVGVSNGALHAIQSDQPVERGPEIRCSRSVLASLVMGRSDVATEIESGQLVIVGGSAPIAGLFDHLERFERFFDVVTPG